MANKLKKFCGKFLKVVGAKFDDKRANVVKPEKQMTFSDLLDDCIKLLETPGKVKARPYQNDTTIIEIYSMENNNQIFWMAHNSHRDNYRLVFSGDRGDYKSSDFGEHEKMQKLYDLCKQKEKETAALFKAEGLAAARRKLVVSSEYIKRYM